MTNLSNISNERLGLTTEEALQRLKKYGYNEIREEKKHPILKFLSYFWGPLPWMIEAAAILSAILEHWVDFTLIVILLFVNAVIGFVEEYKAENVIELLKKKMALRARVLRDGKWKIIDARELVPGDVIRLRIGDIVPADAEIISGKYAMIDESMLTGESQPVEKKVGDKIYSGSVVKRGEVDAIVTATGKSTYFGKTIEMVKSVKEKTGVQTLVIKIGDYLIAVALALIFVILIDSFFSGQHLMEALRFSLVLLVSSIPVAMPAVLSIIMAKGALQLARKNILVTKLASIEELSTIDVLCCDKTGTLTKNKLTVGEVYTCNDFSEKEVLLFAALASRKEDNDPIDLAIFEKSEKLGIDTSKYTVKEFTPFDPVIKRTEAIVEVNSERFKAVKGAPQVIMELCKLNEDEQKEIEKKIEDFAKKGYRALAVAIEKNGKWKFVGLISLYDPPREDSAELVQKIKSLGIRIKMITGDHVEIAKTIAKTLGIGEVIYSMKELLKLRKKEEFSELVEKADGFSEVFPEHKFKIVECLQRHGHKVAMTGDGVNDVPALKKANVGIAVYGATDAARAAADLVLLKPGLSVIYDAIKEARRIFQRMKGYIIYRITETIRILFFMTLSILIFHFYPISVLMLILLILLNDIPILSIAYDNVVEQKTPAKFKLKEVLILSTALGLTGVIGTFLIYYYAVTSLKLTLAEIQTLVFLKLVLAGHSTLFITRNRDRFWKKPYPSKYVLIAVLSTDIIAIILSLLGILITPLSSLLVAIIIGYVILWMFIDDFVKVYIIKKLGVYE